MSALTMAGIRARLNQLPGLSPAVRALLPRLGDHDLGADELAAGVGQDALLAARVLRLANSPFYGLPRQVGSLRDAVVILGFSNLRGLVLSAGLVHAFADVRARERSLAVAVATGSLARSLRLDHGMAFTAGLLHNLGALLLGHFAPEPWRALELEPAQTWVERQARERQVFGFDHGELGADIVADWRFPDAIQAAIRLHRQPPDEPAELVGDLVHAGWAISHALESGAGPVIQPGVMVRLELEGEAGAATLAKAAAAIGEGVPTEA